jgi:hypothetical protein
MQTLASCGCSFSDYTGDSIQNTYGEVAAKSLNLNYLHLAQGCSSKDRVYKSIVSSVIDGKLKSGDMVIVQFPDPFRHELMSPMNHYIDDNDQWPEYIFSSIEGMVRDSSFGRYSYYNFKPLLNDYTENSLGIESDLYTSAKNLSDATEVLNAVNERFVMHNWQTNNYMLEAFLEKHNIELMYFMHRTTGLWHHLFEDLTLTSDSKYWNDRFDESVIWGDFGLGDNEDFLLGWDTVKGIKPIEADTSHYSQIGHTFIGEKLAQHILNKR